MIGLRELYYHSGTLNIFKRINNKIILDENILRKNSLASNLDRYINSYYMNVSNARDDHSEEIPDINNILKILKDYIKENQDDIERVDKFNIKELIETLKKLIVHLEPEKEK